MSKYRMLLATATALALGLATAAVAQPPEGREFGRRGPGGPGDHGRMARYLDLNEDQRQQLEGFAQEMRTSVEPLMQQQRELREQRQGALEAQDPCALGEAELASHALRTQTKGARDAFKANLESILTAEQKQKLEMMEAARAVGERGRGRRGRGQGPPGDDFKPPNQ